MEWNHDNKQMPLSLPTYNTLIRGAANNYERNSGWSY